MSDDTADTTPAIEVVPVKDRPSWHAPVAALQDADARHEARLNTLESGFVRLEAKTDVQTVMLGEIKGFIFGAAKTAAENPWIRRFVIALALAFSGALIVWLGKHGIKVEFAP